MMLQTFYKNQLQLRVSDTTVSVMPGLTRFGNSLFPFQGVAAVLDSTTLTVSANKYKNVLLYLSMADTSSGTTAMNLDMTASPEGSMRSTLYQPAASGNNVYPVGILTLHNDGTNVSIYPQKY